MIFTDRPLSKGCDKLSDFLLFVFSDGNIGSEDSSLSDALVLEDGRWLGALGRGSD